MWKNVNNTTCTVRKKSACNRLILARPTRITIIPEVLKVIFLYFYEQTTLNLMKMTTNWLITADITADELFNMFFGGGFPQQEFYVRRGGRWTRQNAPEPYPRHTQVSWRPALRPRGTVSSRRRRRLVQFLIQRWIFIIPISSKDTRPFSRCCRYFSS